MSEVIEVNGTRSNGFNEHPSKRKAKVQFEGQTLNVAVGATVGEVLGQIYISSQAIVGATLNNHAVSLNTRVDGDSVLEAIKGDSREGQSILRRTSTHIFHAALSQAVPQVQVMVGQSLLGGYYYEVQGWSGELSDLAAAVTAAMTEMIDKDLPLERQQISVEALDRWVADPFGHKQRLLRAWAGPVVQIVTLEGFSEMMHGPCAASTGVARGARVICYPPGLILMFPDAAATSPLPCAPPSDSATPAGHKLFLSYRETRNWNRLIGVSALGDLNAAALEDRFDEVIRLAEALHEKKIAEIADAITERRETLKLVCIAGPSSSGKTTFLRRLSVQLLVNGLEPVPVSLDDFYRCREQCPRDERGDYDFEALEALDLELLDVTLGRLLQGEAVAMPRFDFEKGQPIERSRWHKVQLRPGQIAVIEGIHGLNPALLPSLRRQERFNIFVSALTSLIIDEHNRIFTSDSRLLRRIVRDRRYRGTCATDTIARWPSVRRGEERYIFPFQELSDAMFNSTLVYEAAVLKPFAWRYLLEVPRHHSSRVRAYELLKFLELIVPVFPDAIPANSVMREFIGGSGFVY